MKTYDVAVIGLGAMGSSASYYLSRAGAKVVGFDRWIPPHPWGSSHGETRLTRTAYYEDPSYVPLLRRSHALWRELENKSQRSLFHQTGLVYFGKEGSAVLSGVRRSAALHQIDLSANHPIPRFPIRAPSGMADSIFESEAGYLEVEEAIKTSLTLASQSGATFHFGTSATNWEKDSDLLRISTVNGEFWAKTLLLCAGSWNPQLFQWKIPLTVHRQTLFWMSAEGFESSMPCFAYDLGDHFVYGFSPFNGRIKIADHTPGEVVIDPANVDRIVSARDSEYLRKLATSKFIDSAVCLYTMTPDSHFVLGRHPRHANVFLAGGFSGHGFKFAPVVGEILHDFALKGATQHDIGLFSVTRFD